MCLSAKGSLPTGGGEPKQSSRHRQPLSALTNKSAAAGAFSVSLVMIDLHWLLSTVAGAS